jgi:hypothetical protein
MRRRSHIFFVFLVFLQLFPANVDTSAFFVVAATGSKLHIFFLATTVLDIILC